MSTKLVIFKHKFVKTKTIFQRFSRRKWKGRALQTTNKNKKWASLSLPRAALRQNLETFFRCCRLLSISGKLMLPANFSINKQNCKCCSREFKSRTFLSHLGHRHHHQRSNLGGQWPMATRGNCRRYGKKPGRLREEARFVMLEINFQR